MRGRSRPAHTALLKGLENAQRRYALEAELPPYDLQRVGDELLLAGPGGGRETPAGFAQELAKQIAGRAASLTPRLSRFLADHIDSLLDFLMVLLKLRTLTPLPPKTLRTPTCFCSNNSSLTSVIS